MTSVRTESTAPRRWHWWISLAAVVLVGFLLSRDALARLAWRSYRLPEAAMALNWHDARLAVEIGNYYFNGPAFAKGYGGHSPASAAALADSGAYDLDRARAFFERAIAIDPRVPYAWHQLARIDFARRDFAKALGEIDRQIEIHGDSLPNAYYVRGLVNGYSGDLAAAEQDFRNALEKGDRTHWAIHNDLAWIYFREGKYREAEEISRRGLQWNEGNFWLLNSLLTLA